MKVADYPELLLYKGEDIIFTDGNTLLGADDKAGVAAIVSAAERLLNDDSIKHGKIRICFTPDEEIGQGADHFDVSGFNADFAYTLDGGRRGELEYESFNAAAATVTCRGISVHPGSALGKMKNAQLIAMDFYRRLPADEIPQMTSDRQGFFHITHVEGDVEKAVMNFIIRDFDIRDFENRKQLMSKIAADINSELDGDFVSVEIRDQYYNMRSCLEPVMYVVDYAREAIRSLGIETIEKPIRGGTDGARLSFMGLPTPNVFAGGENFHGRYEFLPVKSLEMASAVVVKIAEIVAQKGSK
jgi:tripeptide aminopeptidase